MGEMVPAGRAGREPWCSLGGELGLVDLPWCCFEQAGSLGILPGEEVHLPNGYSRGWAHNPCSSPVSATV